MASYLISGASGGVAQALAQRLRARGDTLVLVSRDAGRLDGQDAALRISADCTTPEGALSAFTQAREALGAPVDGFAHCIGSTLIAPLSRTRPEQLRDCLSINVESAFHTCQAYIGQLQQARSPGAIVLFSSVVAGMGVSSHPAIAAAKGAIEALTRALAADHAAAGVRVNCVAPGLLRTPMTERMVASESAARQIAAQYPLGRHGEADDGAAAAAFLLGPDASWITGQVLHVDGGFSAIRPYVRS
jgi:NAD(P)-dependent dehydrogenase (short-subunit alcohol dehydrogenase family)